MLCIHVCIHIVVDLDAALRLFPRYSRALFRRAACLLEDGKAEMAVEVWQSLGNSLLCDRSGS